MTWANLFSLVYILLAITFIIGCFKTGKLHADQLSSLNTYSRKHASVFGFCNEMLEQASLKG